MADTLTTQSATPATVPANSVIATDDAGASGHVQIVKLALSTDGSAAPITANADGLEVQGAGTAGTPAGGVVTIQGVTSMTAVKTDGSGVTQPVSGTVSVTGVATAANQSTEITALQAIQTAVETIDNTVSGSELQVDVVGALPAGTNNIGDVDVLSLPALAAGTNNIGDVDILSIAAGDNNIGNVDIASIAAGDNNIGNVDVLTLPAVTNAGTFAVQPSPATSGGLSISRDIDLDNGTLTVVKASAGQVYGWSITNRTTGTVYVKFYNATSGTLGTGTPVLTIGIPGNASDHTMLAQSFGGMGIVFSTGISVGAGTGVADADNTDPGANGVVANIYYA